MRTHCARFMTPSWSAAAPCLPTILSSPAACLAATIPCASSSPDPINAAKTPEELFTVLVAWGSGYTGGTSRVAFSMTVLGKTIGNVGHGTEGPYGPYATVDDLLNNPDRRAQFATRFQNRVEELYSPRRIMRQICGVYDAVLRKEVI